MLTTNHLKRLFRLAETVKATRLQSLCFLYLMEQTKGIGTEIKEKTKVAN